MFRCQCSDKRTMDRGGETWSNGHGGNGRTKGGELLDRLKQLIAEGNVRRVVVKQEGQIVAEFPLSVGVVGTVLAPVAAAIGALVALLTHCTIEVERTEGRDG
jgi:hypothetical protein